MIQNWTKVLKKHDTNFNAILQSRVLISCKMSSKKTTAQQKMDNFTESMAPFLGNVPLFTPMDHSRVFVFFWLVDHMIRSKVSTIEHNDHQQEHNGYE